MINARSICSELNELHFLLDSNSAAIYLFTETWFNDNIPDALILDGRNFTLFRKDRLNGIRGGGVCALIDNSLVRCVQCSIPDKFSDLEIICFDLLGMETRYRFIVYYRAPYYDCGAINLMSLTTGCFELLLDVDASVVLAGDFNFPSINWTNTDNIFLNSDFFPNDEKYEDDDDADICMYNLSLQNCRAQFLKFIERLALIQMVTLPTRLNNILDLVLVNNPFSVHSVFNSEPFSNSDHDCINFSILVGSCENMNYEDSLYYDYNLADWNGLRQAIAENDWNIIFSNYTGDELWNAFRSIVFVYIDKFVPKKVLKKSRKKITPNSILRKYKK